MALQVLKPKERKARMMELIKARAKGAQTIAVTRIHKVRAEQLMEIKRKFRDRMQIMVVKNRVCQLALKQVGKEGMDGLFPFLEGQNALIFTDMDPFTLHLTLEKNKVELPAKAGDLATDDIIIPAGNTGLPPGAILTEFKEAKVPTKIDTGSIWVTKDTVVAKKGEVISPKLAGLLARLELKPIRAGLSISACYYEGRVLKGEEVAIDPELYRKEISSALGEALAVAFRASYPSNEVLPLLFSKAQADALALTINASYPSKEGLQALLPKALSEAQALLDAVSKKGYPKPQ